MDTLEYFRLFNVFVAGLAFILNMAKATHFKFHKSMDGDSLLGFMALMSWCLAYSLAASLATVNEVETGIWTVIMGLPCVWTLIAGLRGWNRLENADATYLRIGALSPNEIRQRRKR